MSDQQLVLESMKISSKLFILVLWLMAKLKFVSMLICTLRLLHTIAPFHVSNPVSTVLGMNYNIKRVGGNCASKEQS